MENEQQTSTLGNESIDYNLGSQFNSMEYSDFLVYLHQLAKANPLKRFSIVADWVSIDKARSAKALLDQYSSRFHIDSLTIRATRQQYEEDVNVFASGVKWEEI